MSSFMVKLIDEDEIIEIKNTEGHSLQEILNALYSLSSPHNLITLI